MTVRILGVDAPETKKPGYTVGCWGPEAARFATDTLLNQPVQLVTDPTQDRVDRYGRTLAYVVKVDGWNFSVEAARAGVVHSYVYNDRPVVKATEIAAAETHARDAGTGLWGAPCNGNTDSVSEIAVAPPAPAPAPPGGDVYYKNCRAAWAAGAAPLRTGDAGYRSPLDADGDGIACEVRPN
ncbi:thermonuclease family protein [Aldersonia sp. NBC_00410]|uniref:thermonuclease family protein n=1 Tax=Aldersonia sp. NBC_00410 TaxID=2975954 RepID=UPI002B1CEC29|nr:thermonuclease family protein [Aldersonia sp. NBC_00410]